MKTGLRYYHIDTDRYQDRKIKKLKKSFGCAGVAVYDYILCEVYRVEGCGIVWDEDTAFDVAEYWGLKETTVKEIVKYCGVVGLFDQALLSGGVITSLSIQRRYLEMCKKSRRADARIPEEWLLITGELPKNHTKSNKMYEETQKTLPKIKENKIKENISLSLSLSAESEKSRDEDDVREQRDDFYKIFFYNNFQHPDKEVERFIAHYSACGWLRSNGQRIVDKAAAAQLWTQEKNVPPRFAEGFTEAIKVVEKNLSHDDGMTLLRGVFGVQVSEEGVRVFCNKDAHRIIERFSREFRATPFVGGMPLLYAVKREE